MRSFFLVLTSKEQKKSRTCPRLKAFLYFQTNNFVCEKCKQKMTTFHVDYEHKCVNVQQVLWMRHLWMNCLYVCVWRCVVLLGVCRHTDYGKSSTKGIWTEMQKRNHKHRNPTECYMFSLFVALGKNGLAYQDGKFPHAFALTLHAHQFELFGVYYLRQ